jgi:hypothetical protein
VRAIVTENAALLPVMNFDVVVRPAGDTAVTVALQYLASAPFVLIPGEDLTAIGQRSRSAPRVLPESLLRGKLPLKQQRD